MNVILVAAISLDGFITRHDEPGSAFTSAADSRHLRRILPGFDCCILGAATYRVDPGWIRTRLMPGKLRTVVTRTPEACTPDAEEGVLEFTAADPQRLIESLRERGFRRCALLGGGRIYSLFLQAGCVQELWLTVEARLFGSGTAFCPGRFDLPLNLLSHQPLGDDALLLKYEPRRAPRSPAPLPDMD